MSSDSLILTCEKNIFLSFILFLFPSLLLGSALSALSSSPGTLLPSDLIPLQSHPLHLIPGPASLTHHYFGFTSWMSSVSFTHPSAIQKVKSKGTRKQPRLLLPHPVSPLGRAEGRRRQQSIRAQWQELCCSDRVQYAVSGGIRAEHREVLTGLTPPADR